MDIKQAKRECNIQRWKTIIEERNATSLSVDEYCRQNGLSRHAYFYWLRIIRRELLKNSETAELQCTNSRRFVELAVPREDQADTLQVKGSFETAQDLILTLNGVTIRVSEGTSPALLAKTLGVIRNA